MKNIILVGLLLTLPFIGGAQTIGYSESHETSIKKMQSPTRLFKMVDGDPVITLSSQKGMKTVKSMIRKLDGSTEASDFGVPYKDTYSYTFWHMNGTNYRLMLSKEKETRSLHERIVTYSDDGKPLDLIHDDKVDYKSKDDFPSMNTVLAPDSSYAAVFRYVDDNSKKAALTLHFTLFDANMKKVHSASWLPKGKKSQQMNHVLNYAVGTDGSTYILVKEYMDKYKEARKKGKEAVSNYKLSVLKYSKEGQLTTHDLKIDDNFSSTYSMLFFEDGTPVVITNMCSSGFGDASAIGFRFYIWDDASDSYSAHSHEWSADEIAEFGNWRKSKVPGLRPNFDICTTKAHGDKITFLTENRWREWRSNGNTKYEVLEVGCAFAMTFDKSGTKTDHLFVPKQIEMQRSIPSPILHMVGDRPIVIYNDDKKNFKKSIPELRERLQKVKKYRMTGKTILAAAYADSTGELVIEMVPDTEGFYLVDNYGLSTTESQCSALVVHDFSLLKKTKVVLATFDFSDIDFN